MMNRLEKCFSESDSNEGSSKLSCGGCGVNTNYITICIFSANKVSK